MRCTTAGIVSTPVRYPKIKLQCVDDMLDFGFEIRVFLFQFRTQEGSLFTLIRGNIQCNFNILVHSERINDCLGITKS